MIINTNISAQTGARLLAQNNTMLSKSLARLSSGLKIVSPSDDAAGLAVSTRFDAQINRISAATTNVGNAVSYSQTQDGYLQQIGTALDRMSTLSLEAQDVTKSSTDKGLYQTEFSSLSSYINDIATKDFNGVSLLDGTNRSVTSDSEGKTFSITGITGSSFDMSAQNVQTDALTALTTVKAAINTLASDRATVGANIGALNAYSNTLGVLNDNLTAANSQIKDVDVAQESTNFAKYNILVQTGTAMLAQANTIPQSVLKLLQ
jgi:flagellin